ncbi:arylesterase [Leptospira borgpetersenii]|uniref:Lipase/Acylhydrolase n=2 Tax=Leptospira borgpetersenii serovar Hardjo-bovis TaxID=338217 RepID=Q04TR6_LEPBJ|nr:arylesterase [Leptospira borgpetersenii]ABJ75704.1 Lipase/Acylhydrolase [Leptospira borgpetersenii serovar Hardjo-bovis str. JB197]ABJ78647.1 Lipase/Acylhydrolase [Leptospira borgpetersenii serovar Hardjo-bovis str. L550]AMX57930.1 acyl-CoA thioesterase [Leptospira borgpetersenii serovar Hardjo]AMX61162.1 acyl-CoA thioesterase [Leptospira borgpetersenii serovar Hardjo]AMX64406.1 acyl-CoA thioesterase [Leptospira borgpetersenii serovar Hardjo]
MFLFRILIFISSCSLFTSIHAESNVPKIRILFFGDSLTAGLGLGSPEEAFPALVEKELFKSGISTQAINAGMSGDTTSGGLARLDWAMSSGFDLFVLELGANDSMRGISPDQTEKNLKEIIVRVKKKNPKVKILLVGMKTFPNLGKEYRKKFEAVFPKIAKEENLPLVPFFLNGVAGVKKLNQKDGIHPTAEGHRILAKNLFPFIQKILKKE